MDAKRLVQTAMILTVLIITYVTACLPPSYTADANGCGPWGTGWLFPEFWFTSACNLHDVCFRAGRDKHTCNLEFYDAMKVICETKTGLVQRVCFAIAWAGFQGVEVANR